MNEFKEIKQDRLKVHFAKPEGVISRRELLKLAIPRYEVVPFVDPDLCRGDAECGLCLKACPLEAIKAGADEITVDTTLCSGCGACVDSCPHRAIVYPGFTLEELDREMAGRFLSEGTSPKPEIIALICQNCLSVSDRDSTAKPGYPSSIASLKIPCLTMASPWLMLRAFDRGAQGLALVSSRESCPAGPDASKWRENVSFVRGLLECWGIEPERIGVFEITTDDASEELGRFAEKIGGLHPTPLNGAEPTSLPGDSLILPALIKGMMNKLDGSLQGVVTDGLVPFGRLELDGSRCTGCGLCAVDCPTGALTAASLEDDGYQLLFRHDTCIACRRCVEICPEQCLRLERILELARMNSPAAVLFEDGVARCRECGSIIGPRAMIKQLQVRLRDAGESVTSQLELCIVCKKKQLNLSIPAFKPVTGRN